MPPVRPEPSGRVRPAPAEEGPSSAAVAALLAAALEDLRAPTPRTSTARSEAPEDFAEVLARLEALRSHMAPREDPGNNTSTTGNPDTP